MIKRGDSFLLAVLLFLTLILQLMSSPVLGRDKTDVVILKNGDRVTGEIKSLDRDKMRLSTDHMGTVEIEWSEVEQVTSQFLFEVETETGLRTVGALGPAAEPETLEIIGEGSRNTLQQTSVVRMTQIEAGFLARVQGFVDIGFSFARANLKILTLCLVQFSGAGHGYQPEDVDPHVSFWEQLVTRMISLE